MIPPPHLPPPVCNIDGHHRWQRLKTIFAAAVFGLAGGIAGASVVLGWIWPGFGQGDMWATGQSALSFNHGQLEERVREEMTSRVVEVYEDLQNLNGAGFLSGKGKLGEAIIASSDGWLAMYYPNFIGNFKNWRVLAQDGTVYRVEKALPDRRSGALYLKIFLGEQKALAGERLKVASFSDQVNKGDEVYVYQDGNWGQSWLNYLLPGAFGYAHLDSAPNSAFLLSGSFRAGAVAINAQGRVVGLVMPGNLLLPNYYITRVLPGVLSRQSVTYPTIGVEGWFDEEQPVIVAGNRAAGLAVSKVWGAKNPLRRGDVILEVNGQVVHSADWWYNLSSKTLRLKVWRSGKTIEVTGVVSEM